MPDRMDPEDRENIFQSQVRMGRRIDQNQTEKIKQHHGLNQGSATCGSGPRSGPLRLS